MHQIIIHETERGRLLVFTDKANGDWPSHEEPENPAWGITKPELTDEEYEELLRLKAAELEYHRFVDKIWTERQKLVGYTA